MRIAMLAPISWRVPPRHYGPWELVVSLLTEGLVERGVDVTLFATADSLTKAKLQAVCPRPYSEDAEIDPKVWECLHIANVFEQADQFDLIHNHFDFLPLSYSRLVRTPVITTIHGFSSPRILPVYRRYDGRCHFVAISNADRAPGLNYLATIHHGIRFEDFEFSERARDYLLFYGRIHPDKGTAEAIEVAKRIGCRLVIAGIIQNKEYFDSAVAPHIRDGAVEYIGSVGPARRSEILGGAMALLHLVNFSEPFGLSVVEAMACGTPVVASARGSMPEIIDEGKTGFLVESLEEAAGAVAGARDLDRAEIRRIARARFSDTRMVEDYLRAYEAALRN